jgi:hypothetical protein
MTIAVDIFSLLHKKIYHVGTEYHVLQYIALTLFAAIAVTPTAPPLLVHCRVSNLAISRLTIAE